MCSFLPIELSRVFSPLLTDRGFSSVQQIHIHSYLDGYWHVGSTQHILVIFFDQGIDLSCKTVSVHLFDVSPPWVNTCPAFIWFCVSTVAAHEKAMTVFSQCSLCHLLVSSISCLSRSWFSHALPAHLWCENGHVIEWVDAQISPTHITASFECLLPRL